MAPKCPQMGSPWLPMAPYEFLWGLYGSPWLPMGTLLLPMGSLWAVWDPRAPHYLILSIHVNQVRVCWGGLRRSSPLLTAALAPRANSAQRTNHCGRSSGSTTSCVRLRGTYGVIMGSYGVVVGSFWGRCGVIMWALGVPYGDR